MKEKSKLILVTFAFIAMFSFVKAESKALSLGDSNAKIIVKVFSSLTCPHCASFHEKIFPDLKKEYIDKGLVVFEHHSFPLDLAALNAEIIIKCNLESNKSFQLLGEIYKKQSKWAIGSDINVINESIKNIGLNSGLSNNIMENCLKDEKLQQQILNERIDAQKNYQIKSTPTIYINKKKYDGNHEYKQLKEAIEKIL